MHELSLMADLMRKIASIAQKENAKKIVRIKVKLGALCHISPEHFRGHFILASHKTVADGAALVIEVLSDTDDPAAQEILLESVDIEHE